VEHKDIMPKKHGEGQTSEVVKKYELNVFHKRSSQLSKSIYNLPLDIKEIIYKMAIDTYMEKWAQTHKNTMKSWSGLKTRHKPFSCLDLIKGWGIQAPLTKFFQYIPTNTEDFRGSIPIDYKMIPCGKDRVSNREGFLIRQKVDLFKVKNVHEHIMYNIQDRHVENKPDSYWVGKRCRCLTCDLIRLAHHQNKPHWFGPESILSSGYWGGTYKDRENISADFKKKYDSITYMGGQWKVHSKTEALTPKELKMLKKKKHMKG